MGRILDVEGNEVPKGTICIAEEKLDNGDIKIYRRIESEIAMLIEAMKNEASATESIYDVSYWLSKDTCSRQAADKCGEGTCGKGSCEPFTNGHFTWCKCQ